MNCHGLISFAVWWTNISNRSISSIKIEPFSDLMVGLISVLTDIVWRITIAWVAGNLACKLLRYLQAVVSYSSTYVLVALSIDRYDAITRPMNFSRSCKYFLSLSFFHFFSSVIRFRVEREPEKESLSATQCTRSLARRINLDFYCDQPSSTGGFFPPFCALRF